MTVVNEQRKIPLLEPDKTSKSCLCSRVVMLSLLLISAIEKSSNPLILLSANFRELFGARDYIYFKKQLRITS